MDTCRSIPQEVQRREISILALGFRENFMEDTEFKISFAVERFRLCGERVNKIRCNEKSLNETREIRKNREKNL